MSQSAQQADPGKAPVDYIEVTVKIPRAFYAYLEAWAKRTNKTVAELISEEFQHREFDMLDDISALEIMEEFFPGIKKEGEKILDKPDKVIKK